MEKTIKKRKKTSECKCLKCNKIISGAFIPNIVCVECSYKLTASERKEGKYNFEF